MAAVERTFEVASKHEGGDEGNFSLHRVVDQDGSQGRDLELHQLPALAVSRVQPTYRSTCIITIAIMLNSDDQELEEIMAIQRREENLLKLINETRCEIVQENGQRKLGGPPPSKYPNAFVLKSVTDL